MEEGEAEFFIENHAFLLKKGDGIFVPPKLMHWARTKGTVLFHAAVADPLWLISPHNSECFQKYMYPVCSGSWKYAVTFTSEKNWQKEILAQLKFIFSMDEEKIAAKELLIQGTFLLILQKLYDHHLKSFLSMPETICKIVLCLSEPDWQVLQALNPPCNVSQYMTLIFADLLKKSVR